MPAGTVRLTTGELSKRTWPDFVRLFSQGGGWDSCGCALYPRGCHLPRSHYPSRAAELVENHRQMRQLVEEGRTRGILVYAGAEPVGWCQYGRVAELPLPGLARPPQKVVVAAADPTSQWRITCFVTHKSFRRQGVAKAALTAALESIRRQGGGWVEGRPIAAAYPHIDRRVRELQRTYGKRSAAVHDYVRTRVWPEVLVPGVGPVKAARGTFGSVSHSGTVSMFDRAGFEVVRSIGDTKVLMRRKVSLPDPRIGYQQLT